MDSNFSQFMQEYTQRCAQNRPQPQQLQLQQATPPDSAPPPYSASSDSDSDSDSDDSDSDEDTPPSPVKLTINAAHSIQGSNNLVPTSATPLADASKFGTLLLHAINQINGLNPSRALKVDLTINCGLTVVGDRNVIGNVGLKPRTLAGSSAAGPVVAGAKRKADESIEDANDALEPAAKKVAVASS